MLSSRIINSAKFLQMPEGSQLLYFHLILRADDDGVAEAYPVMKLLGTAPDNFKVLLAKGFIRQLNEDQVIVITDWLEHNTIRADRKVDSMYKELLVENNIEVIQPKPRSDVKDNSKRIGGPSTDSISKDRLGEVSISKDNTESEGRTPKEKATQFFSDKEAQNKVIDWLISKGYPEQVVRTEVAKFVSYWTELNGTGKKQRWQMEPVFDIQRRFQTWFSRIKQPTNGGVRTRTIWK